MDVLRFSASGVAVFPDRERVALLSATMAYQRQTPPRGRIQPINLSQAPASFGVVTTPQQSGGLEQVETLESAVASFQTDIDEHRRRLRNLDSEGLSRAQRDAISSQLSREIAHYTHTMRMLQRHLFIVRRAELNSRLFPAPIFDLRDDNEYAGYPPVEIVSARELYLQTMYGTQAGSYDNGHEVSSLVVVRDSKQSFTADN